MINDSHIEEDGMCTVNMDAYDYEINVGYSSNIGSRKENQDSIACDAEYSYVSDGKMIVALCDGMGGLEGGKRASQLCADTIVREFHESPTENIIEFYHNAITKADKEVCQIVDESGNAIQTGTTLVSVVVSKNLLHWASVGDSRIYIIRGDEIVCVTKDHNYLMLLNEKVRQGLMTQEEVDACAKKEALVSFIGINGVPYIDMNRKPFILKDDDYIVLCSDGLYRSLTEQEMVRIIKEPEFNIMNMAEKIVDSAISKGIRHQDNTSVIVLKYTER